MTAGGICAPQEFDLGLLAPAKRRLTVRVDNRLLLPYRPDAHAVSDSLGGTWNGIVGALELRSTPLVWLADVQAFPRAETRSVRVRGRLYTSATGFTDAEAPGPLDQVDYASTGRVGPHRVRGASGWFGRDYTRAPRGVKVPVVAHELGQWCAYPDFDVIGKFTGYLRPGNYEIFRDSAAATDPPVKSFPPAKQSPGP